MDFGITNRAVKRRLKIFYDTTATNCRGIDVKQKILRCYFLNIIISLDYIIIQLFEAER